ncbi:ester cyclase [Xanthomonas sp. LMG 12459]|uniref:ester cyclase n=1 Tax=Xanthomonas sp. LMG 12459 TaxID=1591131 RepID=UPI00126326C5|nr:ester cyclase [Xanthomonas sp. LMG 12459]KAB7780544.1 ester cyclase [Xanthomonas sp. LMG 12459]
MTISDIKTVVRRFNKEVIEDGDRAAFEALMAPGFVNRSAPPGTPAGGESMWSTFHDVLRPALAGLTVTIHDQVAEGDKVTTRKTVSGRHTGTLFGVEPTGRPVSIEVIDIVRVENGRYVEHWGINNLPTVLAGLRRDESAP